MFYDNLFFTIATVAIVKIHVYYKNVDFYLYRQISLENHKYIL